jgi:predicted hotdog family 3-hydroxylacyl-ACP dehydratase
MAPIDELFYHSRNDFGAPTAGPRPKVRPSIRPGNMQASNGLPQDRQAIAALIPHSGRMCLLDRVIDCSVDRIRCAASSHRDPANPLRRNGVISAVCGIEYAAQAMALHGALGGIGQGRAKQGYLVSLRETVVGPVSLDRCGQELVIEARRLHGEGSRVIYEFSLQGDTGIVLRGRAGVFLDAAQSAAGPGP